MENRNINWKNKGISAKNCGKSQAEVDDRVKYSDEERRRVLVLYLEGCGFRRIARIMKEFFGKEYH